MALEVAQELDCAIHHLARVIEDEARLQHGDVEQALAVGTHLGFQPAQEREDLAPAKRLARRLDSGEPAMDSRRVPQGDRSQRAARHRRHDVVAAGGRRPRARNSTHSVRPIFA